MKEIKEYTGLARRELTTGKLFVDFDALFIMMNYQETDVSTASLAVDTRRPFLRIIESDAKIHTMPPPTGWSAIADAVIRRI